MAGVKLAPAATAVYFGAVDPAAHNVVVSIAGTSSAQPGTQAGSIKATPFQEFPGKGRATGGVRCQRFLRGEDVLILGWVGPWPAKAAGSAGVAVPLPPLDPRRDMSGVPAKAPILAIAGLLPAGSAGPAEPSRPQAGGPSAPPETTLFDLPPGQLPPPPPPRERIEVDRSDYDPDDLDDAVQTSKD